MKEIPDPKGSKGPSENYTFGNKPSSTHSEKFSFSIIKNTDGSSVIPYGVLSGEERKNSNSEPMSIDDMLAWKPSPLIKDIYSLHNREVTIEPTRHALSQTGSKEEQRRIYQEMREFLQDPEIANYISQEFHVAAKAFRGRPPLQIVADSKDDVTGIHNRYLGKIIKLSSSSHYFVLENEHNPLASTGFNQFADGVELRYVQGVHTDKIGESAKDFDRLGNGLEKLAGVVEKYAEYQNLKYAMILPASQQRWVNPQTFPMERAKKIYDAMAGDRGYTYNPKLKRFIKPLS